MERLRLILVGIEGAVNLGMIARLTENFQVEEFYLVSPRADLAEAREYAARASNRLDEAVIVGSLEEGIKGVSLSFCTSAIASDRDPLRIPVDPEKASTLAASVKGTVALVLGRESVGLTRGELEKCDLLVNIPANPTYSALNVTNAAAILLYEFYKARASSRDRLVSDKYVRLIEKYAWELARVLVSDPKRRGDIVVSLRRLAAMNVEYERDLRALLYLLSRACNRIEGCGSEAAPQV